jgi:peptidyl-prolyl cis-trans isomerase C
MMKTMRGFCCLRAVLLTLLVLCCPTVSIASEKVVATVGDAKITETALDEAVSRHLPRGAFHADIEGAKKETYREEALDELIEIELFCREARKRAITVSDEAVEEIVERNMNQLGSLDALEKELGNRGLTMEAFRERIRKYEMANAVVAILRSESRPSEDAVKACYEQNKTRYRRPESLHLYEILIKVDPAAPEKEWDEKGKYAGQIRKRIIAGEDFGELAYQYSEDPYKVKSGDLGLIHRQRLDPQELEDAAFSLNQGEVSQVIRTRHGFHILKAGERKPEEQLAFGDVEETIRKDLEEKKFEQAKHDTLERLRREIPVLIYLKSD